MSDAGQRDAQDPDTATPDLRGGCVSPPDGVEQGCRVGQAREGGCTTERCTQAAVSTVAVEAGSRFS